MSSDLTPKRRSRKSAINRPPKPYPDFPLGPANNGCWQKRINGQLHYFGKWGRVRNGKLERLPDDGWKDALDIYEAQKDDLYAGRTPRRLSGEELTLAELCNRFLTAKQRKLRSGELGQRMFDEYRQTCDLLIAAFGKNRPVDDVATEDFGSLRAEMAQRWGPTRLGNTITRIKGVFKFGFDNGLIKQPIRYGSEFDKPGKAVLRRHKAANGKNMMEVDAIRRLLDAAPVQIRAMLLLGLNCSFGPTDCATLPLDVLDLDGGWLDYPRPKTGIERRCPLWQETIQVLREAVDQRPEPRQERAKGLIFITVRGRQWISDNAAHPVTASVIALMKDVGVHRRGLGPYTMRHVFRTIADAARDPVAIDRIMGHSDNTMGARYRERIDDSRLQAVCRVVHDWLFAGDDDDGSLADVKPARVTETDSTAPSVETHDDGPATLRLFAGEEGAA